MERQPVKLLSKNNIFVRNHGQVYYLNILDASHGDAVQIVNILTADFPSFNDISIYNGKNIGFYKRAQLSAKTINDTLVSYDKQPLLNLDKLTAFADYKIPQLLRKMGIICYSDSLSMKIDNYELIPVNSVEEVEIRANTIWAIEFIRKKLSETFLFP